MLVGAPTISALLARLGFSESLASVWEWLRWPAAVLLLMVAAALTYHLLPNDAEPFRFLTPGAVLAVIVWVLASLGFHYYVLNFANYSLMYGALGAVLICFCISTFRRLCCYWAPRLTPSSATPPEEADGKEDNAAAYAQGALPLSFGVTASWDNTMPSFQALAGPDGEVWLIA